jgi:hypothetical protein
MFGFNLRSESDLSIENLYTVHGLDSSAYGLQFCKMRQDAGKRSTRAADLVEQKLSQAPWTALKEGDLVLLRRFVVQKHLGQKLEWQWEGPYRLNEIAHHKRSGRLQDLHTGELAKVRRGGLKGRVQVNEFKLFCPRDLTRLPGGEHPVNLVELSTIKLANYLDPGEAYIL